MTQQVIHQQGIIEVLRSYPAFRRLWQARSLSLLGDWFNTLALFAMLRELNVNTPGIIGFLYILKLLPMFLMGPAAGVIADRYNRANIMITTDIVRFCLVMAYFLVPFFPEHAAKLTLVLVFLQASVAAFFEPSRMAILPSLVPSSGLMSANALGAVTWSICYALGTAGGSLMTFAFGWRVVLALDAGSYLLSAVLIMSIGYRQKKRQTEETGSGGDWMKLLGLRDLQEGLVYLKSHPRTTYMLFFKAGLCLAGATEAVFTLLGERVYHWGGRPDLGIGALLASRAVGTGLGPIIGRRFTAGSMESMRRAMLFSFVLAVFSYFVLVYVNNPIVAMLLAFTAALGSGTIWVFSSVILQQLVPDQFLGRVFSAELGLAMLVMAISIFAFTSLAEKPGISLTSLPMGFSVLLLISVSVLTLLGRHRLLRGKFEK